VTALPQRAPRTPRRTIEADWTWTGSRFERGVRITVGDDGRIAALGTELPTGLPDEPTLRLPGQALLPGFVNAHSHAFQRGLRGRGETFPAGPAGATSFWSWREAMYELAGTLDPDRFREITLHAFREMRRAGITTVGEFHYLHHAGAQTGTQTAAGDADFLLDEAILDAATEAGIRVVLLQVYYAAGGPGRPAEGAQLRFRSPSLDAYWRQMDRLASLLDPELQSLGVVAHSLRAATPEEAAALHAEAARRDLPFHLHLEEQVREIEECLAAYGARPMELLLDRVCPDGVSPRVTAVHCTHTDPRDMERFVRGGGGGNVCICPTTEGNLGDGIADVPGIRAAGGSICLGTDSNARISMLEEVRWLELVQRLARERRGVVRDGEGRSAAPLLTTATTAGARALGLDGRVGVLAEGAWADFVTVDLDGPDLAGSTGDTLAESLVYGAGNRAITATAVGGRWEEVTASPSPAARG